MHSPNTQTHRLDNPLRRQLLPTTEILLAFGIKEGDHIADIGCGIGYFTLPAAVIVGDSGRVYAVDVSEDMLAETKRRAEEEKLSNVAFARSDGINIQMESNAVSTAFFCTVLHEVGDVKAVLNETNRILKQDGKIIIIEWDKSNGNFGPPDSHRLDKVVLKCALEEASYVNIVLGSQGEHFYTLTAKKG